ncbi:hypothetical protein ACTI_32340 [Actinoplanes sp. OR16]|nr:hypothetical protein ACTI_32340 [Actinoplanes sp. OR16]
MVLRGDQRAQSAQQIAEMQVTGGLETGQAAGGCHEISLPGYSGDLSVSGESRQKENSDRPEGRSRMVSRVSVSRPGQGSHQLRLITRTPQG